MKQSCLLMPGTKRDENVIARKRSDRSNLKGGIASPLARKGA